MEIKLISFIFAYIVTTFTIELFNMLTFDCCCVRDVLLLEVGFLTILVAPLNFFGLHDTAWHHAHDNINFFLIRWLLFRLTFASGLVKLLSGSDAWWSLTG